MIRIKVYLKRDNVARVRAVQNGTANSLNPVSKIEVRIPSIGVVISNTVGDAYPIKWQFTPADDGLIELRLGNEQPLLDAFITTITGDTESGSQWVSNVPAADVAKLSNFMSAEAASGFSTIPEISSVDRINNRMKLSEAASATATGVSFSVYDDFSGSVHVASIYIYNVDYPDGLFWGSVEVELVL